MGIGGIFDAANVPSGIAEIDEHSEQAYIERVYAPTGNSILIHGLAGMTAALTRSNDILIQLSILQGEKNKLTVASRVVTAPTGLEATTDDENTYVHFASTVFGSAIKPSVGVLDMAAFNSAVSALQADLAALPPVLQSSPNSLYAVASKVLSDITAAGSAEAWVLDNYDKDGANAVPNSVQQAGDYQNNLSLAMTSAQSLSDNQKENVRRYLFVFEEYYKSAAAILSKISGIIEKMGAAIAR